VSKRISENKHDLRTRGNSFIVSPRASYLRGFYFGYYFFAVEHTGLRAAGSET